MKRTTWLNMIKEALNPNIEYNLADIYQRVFDYIEINYPEKLLTNNSIEATIRANLEHNSKDSDVFNGNDIFHMTRGKMKGYWMMIG